MFDASHYGEYFPDELPRVEPSKTPQVRLTPELRATLQKILEQLREFLQNV